MSNAQNEIFEENKLDAERESLRNQEMTQQELQEAFYRFNDCLSDDVEKEEYRIDRWAEEMNISIID